MTAATEPHPPGPVSSWTSSSAPAAGTRWPAMCIGGGHGIATIVERV
jgi:hypothetical protein